MSDLPKNWGNALLGNVVTITQGNSKLTKKFYVADGSYIAFSGSGGDGLMKTYEHEGKAIILSAVGARCGKCFKTSGKWNAIANTAIIRPQIDDDYHYEYLFYLLNNENFWLKGGTAQPFVQTGLSQREITIALPPLNEQKRIVEKLEKLLDKVEAAQARLDKIPAILKRFRQAVLAAACSGKLTANPEKVLWGEEKFLNLLSESLCNGHSVVTADVGFPVLRLTCLKKGLIDLGERKTGKWTEQDASKYIVKVNDFFISRGSGSLTHVGRGGLLTAIPDKVAFPDTLIRARVNHKQLLPAFLALVWESRIIREQVEDVAHTTAGIFKISQKQIEKFVLPVPPLEEQKEIVRRVEDLFQFADQIEARYKRARNYTDKLTQSILAKAFRGELVPQDERDESASLLLERIKAERADNSSDKNQKPKKKAVNQSNLFE